MDNQFQQNQSQNNSNLLLPAGKPKSKYWKFIIAFLIIVALIGGGFFVWEKYFSPEAKRERELQENYEKATKALSDFEEAMRQDTYGGKTPEETLQMFIDALEKEDIELASKYFSLETDTNSPYYLTRNKWEEALRKVKEEGKLSEIIAQLSQIKLTFKDEDGAIFKSYDSKGEVKVLVEIKFNKQSGVWKIESL